MKSIQTKYHGPTNTRGARISATDCGDHRIYVPCHHSGIADHRKAAETLMAKLGWTGELISGDTKEGYVFVFLPKAISDLASACQTLVSHAEEVYPHFEDVRGQRDIANARAALAEYHAQWL